MVNIEDGKRYYIINAKSETVVDLSGADDRSVIGYPRNGGENQQWDFIRVDEGWHIKNVKTGLFLSLDGSQALDNTGVIGYSQPFLWHIWDDNEDSSTIRICVPNTQENLDLSDYGNPAPGTPINIWGRWSGKNQTWKVERA